jgi:hypothetical protein
VDGLTFHFDVATNDKCGEEWKLIAEYQPKFLKLKKVPMSPGLVLETNDCPESDPFLQEQYRSIVAKVYFAVHWIQFDISYGTYAAAQLALFCASAGPLHWAVLTGYLVNWPSFKLTYRKDSVGGLNGYTDSDWGSSLSCQSTTGLMAQYNPRPVL